MDQLHFMELLSACDDSNVRAAWQSNDVQKMQEIMCQRVGFKVDFEKNTSSAAGGSLYTLKAPVDEMNGI